MKQTWTFVEITQTEYTETTLTTYTSIHTYFQIDWIIIKLILILELMIKIYK